jgi:hypothetical protein
MRARVVVTAPLRIRLAIPSAPEVDAFPTPTPGLVIHRSQLGKELYSVTHAASGIPFAAGLPSPEAALGLACDLGTLADWTAPVDEAMVRGPALAMARRWGWERHEPGSGIPEGQARAAGVFR